ncbi:UDP-glucose 4-epimerase [Gammaproteobacteria bacterium 53_120_T64]|nr:UDP-glucose 4-epimerase [Gammaproteobacteria bacterium 53_120_T64]
MPVERVSVTEAAAEVIDRLRSEHGELMFHLSGGCCDGSSPMCFPLGEFRLGGRDLYLGDIHGCGFYMHADQFNYYENCHTIVDVVEGRGASFSLEIPLGLRFLIRSRIFTDAEMADVRPVTAAT